jgi:hypothetical protein
MAGVMIDLDYVIVRKYLLVVHHLFDEPKRLAWDIV